MSARHRNALLFMNGGLGNGLILAPVLRSLEDQIPELTYHSAPNAMLEAAWLRDALGLRGPRPDLLTLWRRFEPTAQPDILHFARSRDVTLIVNLRKEAAERDGNYFDFKRAATAEGIESWDLYELDGADLREPIGAQAAAVLRRHGVPDGSTRPTWLDHLRRPRPDVVGCSVGASVEVKRWRTGRWATLIAALHAEGRTVEVAAGPDQAERAIARQLSDYLPRRVTVRYLSTLAALRDWVASLDVLVSNDTLAVHLGAALGCPTVALYLATEGLIWSPLAAPDRFIGVQSRFARVCPLMKVDGTCRRFYDGCPAPCGNVAPSAVLTAVAALAVGEPSAVPLPKHRADLLVPLPSRRADPRRHTAAS